MTADQGLGPDVVVAKKRSFIGGVRVSELRVVSIIIFIVVVVVVVAFVRKIEHINNNVFSLH